MIYLLDTHVLLWWLSDSPALAEKPRRLIADETHIVYVSAATVWEIAIKRALGKLETPDTLNEQLVKNRFQPLAISHHHAWIAGSLPSHHEDPFDRMLVAQALTDGLTLLTHDRRLKAYGSFVQLV